MIIVEIHRILVLMAIIFASCLADASDIQLQCKPVDSSQSDSFANSQNEIVLNCVPIQTDINNNETSPAVNNSAEQKTQVNQGNGAEIQSDQENATAGPIGEEPPEDISRLFLRESEVLLKPKEVQISSGINYSKSDKNENLRLRRNRYVSVPFDISIGVNDRLEIFAAVPLLYSQSEFVSFNDSSKNDGYGYGDLSLGLSYKLIDETRGVPSLTTSLSQSMPTGTKADSDNPNSIEFTSGFRSYTLGFSLTKSVDPAVIYVTLGYTRVVGKEEDNRDVKPGDSVNYGFGTGFSVNSAISLSGRFGGSYTIDTKVDGTSIIGSGSEAISFDVGLTYQVSNRVRMQTSIDFGLNRDANDATVSFKYIYTLQSASS